jgi:hypothetical protein
MARGTTLLWILGACAACQLQGAGASDSSSGAGSDTGDGEDTGTAGGGSTAGGDPQDTEQPPYEKPTDRPTLTCDGASQIAVLEPGSFQHVMLTPGGDALAVGHGYHDEGSVALLVAQLGSGDADNAVIDRWPNPAELILQPSGAGIDAAGNLHVAYYETRPGGRLRLRKQDPAGVVVHDLDLGPHSEQKWAGSPLAIAPDGSAAIRIQNYDLHEPILSRLDPDGAVLWTRTGADAIQADDLNAEGALVGAHERLGFRVLEPDGSVRVEIAWSFTHQGIATIDPAGNVAIATNNHGSQFRYARFAPDGSLLWERVSTLPSSAYPASIASNASGDLAIGGGLQNELPWRSFALRIDAAGNLLGQHVCDNTPRNNGNAITLSDSGRAVLTGYVWAEDDSEQWGYLASFE